MSDLRTQIAADVLRVEPAEPGIDYAASYPAINTTIDNLTDYNSIIVAAPLWWSNMAAPLQTFLLNYGSQIANKHSGLIVSSSSSVEPTTSHPPIPIYDENEAIIPL